MSVGPLQLKITYPYIHTHTHPSHQGGNLKLHPSCANFTLPADTREDSAKFFDRNGNYVVFLLIKSRITIDMIRIIYNDVGHVYKIREMCCFNGTDRLSIEVRFVHYI